MLEELGLNSYESKVYETLLKLGTSVAKDITSTSGVPKGRIYDVLKNLEHMGLIMSNGGRPNKYSAEPPQLAISRLIEFKEQEFNQIKIKASDTIDDLNKLVESQPKKDELYWKVAIGEELYGSYFRLIRDTQREILGYSEISVDNLHFEMNILQQYGEALNYLSRKNVSMRFLIGIHDNEILNTVIKTQPQLIHLLTSDIVRMCNPLTEPFTIIDRQKVILKIKNPVNGYEDLAAIYIWKDNLAHELRIKFNEVWNSADQISISLAKSV